MDAETLVFIVASGAATGMGGMGILTVRRSSERMLDTLLGFTAGMMLAGAAFSLLVPALERGGLGEVVAALVFGAGTMAVADRFVPHAHVRFSERGRLPAEQLRARQLATLLLTALAIHNVPGGWPWVWRLRPGARTWACHLPSRSAYRMCRRDSRPRRR